jgi:LPXTG-site transpeptidase (sortase) family protein
LVRLRLAALAAVVTVLAAGLLGYALVSQAAAHRGVPASRQQPAPIISSEGNLPVPKAASVAPPHDGLRIEMPELKVDLPIVEGDGYDAPLYKAAHYPGMPWPGEGGRSMIYAHARPGMFGPLFSAKVGQHLQITGRDGFSRKYVVREYYPRWPITDLKWLKPGDHEELVLVTCTTYNYNDPRIIVVGEPE